MSVRAYLSCEVGLNPPPEVCLHAVERDSFAAGCEWIFRSLEHAMHTFAPPDPGGWFVAARRAVPQGRSVAPDGRAVAPFVFPTASTHTVRKCTPET